MKSTNEDPRFSTYTKLNIIAWLLFLLGIILLYMALHDFRFIYVSLFIATFILSIVLIIKNQTFSGIALLLMTLIVPYSMYSFRIRQTEKSIEELKRDLELMHYQDMNTDIIVTGVNFRLDGSRMYCEGNASNRSDSTTFKNVEIEVVWLAQDGKVNWSKTYTIFNDDELKPGQRKQFSIQAFYDDVSSNVRCKIYK
jgi:energy-coupling factor transporter transmembrane protein EcfT